LDELAKYLLENVMIDFTEVTEEALRTSLRADESRDAQALLQKIIEDNGIEELLLTLADCLTGDLSTGITPETIRKHLLAYSES